MKRTINRLIKNEKLYGATPTWMKRLGRKMISNNKFNESIWVKDNPHVGTPYEWKGDFGSKHTVGIIFDFSHYHANYIKACHELKINYRVLKLHADNWIETFSKADCDVFLVWPSVYNTVWKTLFDERLYYLKHSLNKKIFPHFEELFFYESKKRVRDFMTIQGYEIPKTWVFYTEEDALDFLGKTSFPLVAKSDLGAASHGVEIFKNRGDAARYVKQAFNKGYIVERSDQRDRRWGFVLFQEFLDVKNEWRIVRVGDTYFSRLKHKKGEYFSGSGMVSWAKPDRKLLDMTREITDRHSFRSMAIDYFELPDGKILINEMQAMFGGIRLTNVNRNEEQMGKYLWNDTSDNWDFVQGYYYNNACANLRIQWALEHLV